MKRLILMGGRPWFSEDGGKKFVDALFRYHPKEVKLAFCIFAQPEEKWEEVRQVNFDMLEKFKDARKVEHRTITPENFVEVSEWADIIYLPGGETMPAEQIAACGEISKLWDDKVVAGSSAGADLFCEGYIFVQNGSYGRGLGWLKLTLIPHWRSKAPDYTDKTEDYWRDIEKEALRNAPDTPVLRVPEADFVEFTVR